MGELTTKGLEESLYRDEIEARQAGKKVEYFAVTDPVAFIEGLRRVIYSRGFDLGTIPQSFVNRIQEVQNSFRGGKRTGNRLKHAILGSNHIEGCVDIISAPILQQEFVEATPFENQKRIVFLRSYKHRASTSFRAVKETFTGTDLNFINSLNLGLFKFEDLFIDARGGTDFNFVEGCIRKRENDLALQRLRTTYEFALKRWIQLNCALRGQNFDESARRQYKDIARELEILSESDYRQAEALVFVGNAAVHHDIRAYSGLHASLFLHWLGDFVDRTIGVHRLPKSRENRDFEGNPYLFVEEEKEYRIRMALLDSLQRLKRREQCNPEIFNQVSLEDKNIQKERVLQSSLNVINKIRERGINLESGDEMFMQCVNYWKKALNNKRHRDFSAQDAIRAGVFAYSLFYHSKETHENSLKPKTIWDRFDANWTKAIRHKGRNTTRYSQYGFSEIESPLKEELDILKKVVESQPLYVSYRSLLTKVFP